MWASPNRACHSLPSQRTIHLLYIYIYMYIYIYCNYIWHIYICIYYRRWYIIYTWQMLWFASEVPFFIQVTQVLFRNRVWNVKALNWWNLHKGFKSTVRNETHKVRDARWTVHHPRWCWRKRRCSPWCFCHFLSITVMIGIIPNDFRMVIALGSFQSWFRPVLSFNSVEGM